MIVKVKVQYNDTELKREMRPGEVIKVSSERGDTLIKRKVVEFISDGIGVDEVMERDAKIAELEAAVAEKDKKIAELETALKKANK